MSKFSTSNYGQREIYKETGGVKNTPAPSFRKCSTTAGCNCATIEWPTNGRNRREYRQLKKAMRAFFGQSFIRRNGPIS